MYSKNVSTNSGLPENLARSAVLLGGDADGTCIEVADPHHDAARDHQRRRGEAEFLRTEQRADDHVAAGLELPVHLHHDAVAQPVGQQGLLRLGQADLPRDAGVLERGEGRCPRSAIVSRNQHDIGMGLGHPGGHRADPDLGHQLHVDPGRRDWPT